MQKLSNEPMLCRCCRIFFGIVMIGLGVLIVKGTLGVILIIVGVVALASAVSGLCPCSKSCSDGGKNNFCNTINMDTDKTDEGENK